MARVLLIEDDDITRETSALILRTEGYAVDAAGGGRDGFAQLQARAYDLVLADLFLGDMTAIELLDRMHEMDIAVPVIVITGHGSIETAVQAMRRGAIDYALKPLIGDDLIEKVELGLAHAAATQRTHTLPVAHAASRWADAVVALVGKRADVRTVGQWARTVNVSASTLRVWCRDALVAPRASLLLARLLRAVHQSRDLPWRPSQRLLVTDPRTLARMLKAGGLPAAAERVAIEDVLANQTLIDEPDALAALHTALRRAGLLEPVE